jgi:dihydroxyacetone kinase-like predicted kinase
MQRQYAELARSLEEPANAHAGPAEPAPMASPAPIAVLFVVSGEGLAAVARSLGAAAIVAGGQTMNPSVEELLKSANRVPAETVIVLPNNGNVILTAQQAAGVAEKPVRVVKTSSVPQGLSALLAFDPEADPDTAVEAMQRAAGTVRTVEVTHAARATRVGDLAVNQGDAIGLLDDQLVVTAATPLEALLQTTERASPARGGAVTLYTGEGVSPETATEAERRLAARFPEVELQVLPGGQPHYPFIASVE